MGVFGPDVCDRCITTHPLNDAGERLCPKPPIEIEDHNWAPAIIWRTSGATKGYRGGGNIPNTERLAPNPGHNPPTLGQLGLTNEHGKALGI